MIIMFLKWEQVSNKSVLKHMTLFVTEIMTCQNLNKDL